MARPMQTVTLPELPSDDERKRTAWVTRGHDQFGPFASAGVTVRCAGPGFEPAAAVRAHVSRGRGDPGAAPSLDDALLDLERRLLEALADVRALRCELDHDPVR